MRRIRLDYQRDETPLPGAGLVLLAVALLAVLTIGNYYLTLDEQVAEWEAKAEQIENTAHRRGIVIRKGEPKAGDHNDEIRQANAVLRQLTLPWDELFQTIETVGGKDVSLLALEPDTNKHLVKISGEAKNVPAALDYLRRLETQDIFQSLQLQSHQIMLQDPEKPIRFTLQATWKGLP